MTTLAAICARMGSTRFPGKMLAPIADMPHPANVIEDITTALTADATPTPADIDERNWRVDPADGMRPRR